MKTVLTAGLLAFACAMPAGAQMTTGMPAMKYFVGTWTCTGARTGAPTRKATITYTLDSDLLRQWVVVPRQDKMTKAYLASFAVTFDAKSHRYVQTGLDNQPSWGISVAKSWTGDTEEWRDTATSDGSLSHGTLVRTSANVYTYTNYSTLTTVKASFRVSCKRST